MSVTIRYLYHSGFAIETKHHFFIFDYWKIKPDDGGMEQGVISMEEVREKDVVFLVSHKHADHYNPQIIHLKKLIPNCRIILSDDIPTVDGAMMVGPGKTIQERDFSLRTLDSTDAGVAFLLEVDGLQIFHAGDLNWWHWEEESEANNLKMAQDYQSQIQLLGQTEIDLAFIPVDPRLGKHCFLGIDYLMRNVNVRHVIPMHFADNISVGEKLLKEPLTKPYREKIILLLERGASVDLFCI